MLSSWARHFTLTVPLSTQVFKCVPANLMLRVTLRWTSIPSKGGGGGGVEILPVASCYRNRDKLRPDGPLGPKEDFTFYLTFAGDGTPGNKYGLASSCRRFQPSGICSKFSKVVYLCDTQASCIKVFTTQNFLVEFENCFPHCPSTKSTRRMTYATLKQLSAE